MLHNSQKDFIRRHIGPSNNEQQKMLKELNFKSLDDLINSLSLIHISEPTRPS